MIRKIIIVVLTLGAGACAVAWVLSYAAPLVDGAIIGTERRVWTLLHGRMFWSRRVNGTQLDWGSPPRTIRLPYLFGVTWKLQSNAKYIAAHLFMKSAFLVLGAYPAFAFIRGPMRRWRRRRKGLCLKCGYDLTGNESGVCPECGSVVLTLAAVGISARGVLRQRRKCV